jgi:hypothetical protein
MMNGVLWLKRPWNILNTQFVLKLYMRIQLDFESGKLVLSYCVVVLNFIWVNYNIEIRLRAHKKLEAKTWRRSSVGPFKCLRVPWQRELLLVGHKLLYWARTDDSMLNIWIVNICICTDKRLNTADSDWNRQTRALVREGYPQRHNSNRQTSGHENQTSRHTDWLTDRQS